jgi:hypothetical protein
MIGIGLCRLVARELDQLDIGVGTVPVLGPGRPGGRTPLGRLLEPGVEKGIELVDPFGLKFDDFE